jgi:hypothetical protein
MPGSPGCGFVPPCVPPCPPSSPQPLTSMSGFEVRNILRPQPRCMFGTSEEFLRAFGNCIIVHEIFDVAVEICNGDHILLLYHCNLHCAIFYVSSPETTRKSSRRSSQQKEFIVPDLLMSQASVERNRKFKRNSRVKVGSWCGCWGVHASPCEATVQRYWGITLEYVFTFSFLILRSE